ncbi:MAG: DUF4007 family protein [Candidatus Cloacimonetes bacterium]|nr:DUF4007 family protein [Candidatus Cloacimonadota bacterium]
MAKKEINTRLPRNFHRTFKPERQYISAILKFSAEGRSGNAQTISEKTGIPTGESSGKVLPTIDYCQGMGLISVNKDKGLLIKPELTDLGRVILVEDPYLKAEISQWLCHLNLCNKTTGADVWYHVFWSAYHSLGDRFTRNNLEAMLESQYGSSNRSLIGPLLGMYEDDASFRVCGALQDDGKLITRNQAPIKDDLARGYGAWVIGSMERFFPKQKQVSTSELEQKTGWLTICRWLGKGMSDVLDQMERKGILKVDRHMNPWILSPLKSAREAYKQMFDDMI